jgi:Flp pilus assembly protein TadG
MGSGNRLRRHERGQTILLVAISMVSLLAMAALAIDVVSLYVAKSEIQRAADAAALAGAKAMADSGITTLPTADPNFSGGQVQTLAQSMATSAINATLTTNLIAGAAATLQGSPTFNFSTASVNTPVDNPQVTVSLQRTGLPTFFAHIFGRTAASVTASATAEAYNPANSALPQFTPISPRGVKPWLVANLIPNQPANAPFVNTTSGAVTAGVIPSTFYLTANCGGGRRCVITPPVGLTGVSPNQELQYIPAQVNPNTSNVCPACAGGTDFEQAIECYDATPYTYLNCGGGATYAQWDNNVNPQRGRHGETANGTMCLIHETNEDHPGVNSGQDTLNATLWPSQPLLITSNATQVSTSQSIVSIPIFNQNSPPFTPTIPGPITIVGYLQAFINYVSDGTDHVSSPGDVNITVLNVAGCSANFSPATPIQGGSGTSPVPVRLIQP